MVQRLDEDMTEVNFADSFDGECNPKGALTAGGLLKDATVASSKGGCVWKYSIVIIFIIFHFTLAIWVVNLILIQTHRQYSITVG